MGHIHPTPFLKTHYELEGQPGHRLMQVTQLVVEDCLHQAWCVSTVSSEVKVDIVPPGKQEVRLEAAEILFSITTQGRQPSYSAASLASPLL